MIGTFTLLLAAHLLADFSLQNDWLIARKKQLPYLLGHILIVGASAALLLGGTPWLLLALLVATHLLMDAIKLFRSFQGSIEQPLKIF